MAPDHIAGRSGVPQATYPSIIPIILGEEFQLSEANLSILSKFVFKINAKQEKSKVYQFPVDASNILFLFSVHRLYTHIKRRVEVTPEVELFQYI